MKKYRARISDKILSKKLSSKGAVLIEGAKWCGKTTTASQVAKKYFKNAGSCRKRTEYKNV